MTKATLEVVAGPMYAGKTSAILQRILWLDHQGHSVLVIKPSCDTRYSQNHIETHNRLKFPCFAANDWSDVLDNHVLMPYNYHTVFLDEVQFMDPEATLSIVQRMLLNGVDVIAAGLDQDSRGQPFESTSLLLGLADKVSKITAVCSVCGQPATKTQRLDTADTERVAVGSTGMYEPRCREHWISK